VSGNSAGVQKPAGYLGNVDLDVGLAALEVNLIGLARMVRAMVPVLERAGGGKLIQRRIVPSDRGFDWASSHSWQPGRS
jgi:NAD(P)-dependent dehydrogenase (short-subunit alcohol dehydrogenase family)